MIFKKARPRTIGTYAPLAAFLFATYGFASDHAVKTESFSVPTPNAGVSSIAAAANGDVWFAESKANKLGKVSTAGMVTEIPFPIDSGFSSPLAITSGADDRLWFTTSSHLIGAVTTSGAFQKYALPSSSDTLLTAITSGGDNRLYFVEPGHNKIGAITTTGVVSEYAIPAANAAPSSITEGPDGNVWFTELDANRIGRLTPSGAFVEFPLPTAESRPNAITAGPDGNLWFIEDRCPGCELSPPNSIEVVGRITPSGTVTEFDVESTLGKAGSIPHEGIVAGPDGALWFTESLNNRVGRISVSGTITEYDLPEDDANPQSIALSGDHHLWVAASGVNIDRLYRITDIPVAGINSGMTGSWYDPNQSGHGFSLQILPGNILLADWYTFTPEGEATWIDASGAFSGGVAKVDAYQIVGSGAKFPPHFDAKNVRPQLWGSLTFSFTDCNHGQVSWSSVFPNYGSGTMNLTRLTQPTDTACP